MAGPLKKELFCGFPKCPVNTHEILDVRAQVVPLIVSDQIVDITNGPSMYSLHMYGRSHSVVISRN